MIKRDYHSGFEVWNEITNGMAYAAVILGIIVVSCSCVTMLR